MSSAPDELSMQAGQLPTPDGSKILVVVPLWAWRRGARREVFWPYPESRQPAPDPAPPP